MKMTKRERYLSAQTFFIIAATGEHKRYKNGDVKALGRFFDLLDAGLRASEKYLDEVNKTDTWARYDNDEFVGGEF